MSRTFDMLHPEEVHVGSSHPAAMPHMPPNGARAACAPERSRPVDEEVVKLVQQVFILPGAAEAPEAVAFCAADRRAGCSWVCARTAEELAETVSGRVCVVDANPRAPSVHEHFRMDRGNGLADALRSSRPVREFVRPAYRNLWVLTAGATAKQGDGAASQGRLRSRISELRAEFDYVLLDTPAIGSRGDALLLGQLTDGVILVIGSHSTRRDIARMAKASLESANVPILGAVLNKRTYPIPEALYQRL